MMRSFSRIRKDPDRARTHMRAICASEQIRDKSKGTTFVGRCLMTEAQLEYMLQCAKETRAKKTW
jgi:hypothetical protein